MNLDLQKFPIGEFICPEIISETEIKKSIKEIAIFPKILKKEVGNLTIQELKWKYRPNSWSIFQIVHHCADSHMNSFIRFKLTLTEDSPIIKPYREELWAELPDSKSMKINTSLELIELLHKKWVFLLESLQNYDWERKFIHPESHQTISLKVNVLIYAWHCKHHLAHIKQAKKLKL